MCGSTGWCELSATDGTFRKVLVHSLKGEKVPGGLNAAQTRWTATSRLEPGKKYVVQAVAEDSEGMTKTLLVALQHREPVAGRADLPEHLPARRIDRRASGCRS